MNGGMMKAAGHGAVAALAGLLLSSGSVLAPTLVATAAQTLRSAWRSSKPPRLAKATARSA